MSPASVPLAGTARLRSRLVVALQTLMSSGHVSSGNSFVRNRSSQNVSDGFALYESNSNAFRRNEARSNRGNGFALYSVGAGCTGNTLSRNTGRDNQPWDAIDQNPAGANTWIANAFGRSQLP